MNQDKTPLLAEELLKKIRSKPKTFIPLAGLSRKLKVDTSQVTSAAKTLTSWGYQVVVEHDHMAFLAAPDTLIDVEIQHRLKTTLIGRHVHAFSSVQSTNDIAMELAESGAPEGTIVTAEQQTKGRGRFGRSWYSEPGNGIYLSFILRPKLGPEKAPALSIMTAVALADTLSHYLPGRIRIKWPNDVLIGRKRLRKTAGILTELSAERNRINHVIIGVGINVNHGMNDFPPEIKDIATSVRRGLRRKVSRIELLQRFLANLEKEYNSYLKHGLKRSHSRIRRYSSLIGRSVELVSGKHVTEGRVLDINTDGALVMKVGDQVKTIIAGEVTVVKD